MGLQLGNVFIGVQPSFGWEGDPMRLLFEGGFTFYNERWIFGPEPYNVNGYGPDAVISKTESSLGVTYGANNYNPVQGGLGIFGRSFRAGARFTF